MSAVHWSESSILLYISVEMAIRWKVKFAAMARCECGVRHTRVEDVYGLVYNTQHSYTYLVLNDWRIYVRAQWKRHYVREQK